MKKSLKLCGVLISLILLLVCSSIPAFAVNTENQGGLHAVIETDKEAYAVNEDIHVTVTVTNRNEFVVSDVSVSTLLPEGLTLKSGTVDSKIVDLKPGRASQFLVLLC